MRRLNLDLQEMPPRFHAPDVRGGARPLPLEHGEPSRPSVAAAGRVVVKLGTHVLTGEGSRLDMSLLAAIVATLHGLVAAGREVVLVSSGAVGVGRLALGLERLPERYRLRQACAAVGQAHLTAAYQRAFGTHGLACGQLLLSQRDFDDRQRTLAFRTTLDSLLRRSVIPLINENDALADSEELDTEQPAFADNDRLSALVASEASADLLVLLTDVPGVYDRDPRMGGGARLLTRIDDPGQLPAFDPEPGSDLGRGGMASKVDAALMAGRCGCQAVIADGFETGALSHLLAGEEVGTWFPARQALDARQRWIAFSAVPRGILRLDAGAVAALRERNASLLPAGVVRASGHFKAGEILELVAPDGTLVARAMARYDARETRRRCRGLSDRSGVLVSRSDLVLEDPPYTRPKVA